MKHSREFDIAIAGNSLAARIVAALLAKNGCRTLLFENPTQEEPGWSFSSTFIENLLGALGGRSCFTQPLPFQVISPRSRITLHSETPIEAELKREFGSASGTLVTSFLDNLQEKGQKINQLLWHNHGLPWQGINAHFRFRLRGIRKKILIPELTESLQAAIDGFDPLAKEFLNSLFQGLSLRRAERLTLGEAALLWAQAVRPENLSGSELNTLLQKRFEQFHGQKESLEDLESLDFKGQNFIGGQIRAKGAFRAKHLLIGDLTSTRRLLPENMLTLPITPEIFHYKTSDLQGQLSDLLADQVILGSTTPLRFSTFKDKDATIAAISSAAHFQTKDLKRILEPALPFANFQITTAEKEVGSPLEKTGGKMGQGPLVSASLRFSRNVFCADNSLLFPGMGPAGSALLGWTLVNRLGSDHL